MHSTLILRAAAARRETLGFIGLGVMGSHMLDNLVRKAPSSPTGPRSFVLFDANAAAAEMNLERHRKENPAADISIANSPQEVASLSSTVISMVPTSKHVKEVYLGPKGVLEALKGLSSSDVSETLCIDESTIEQSESRNISQEIKAVGAEMIDAPVSGGAVGARDGTLTMMVGGSREAFLRSVPVLQLMGKSVLHCGDLGAGLAAKLANNLLLGISMAGVAEVMLLGKRLGLQPQQLAEIINSSTGRCWASEVNNPVPEVSVNISPPPSHREYRGGFATKLAHKDLVLAVAAAREAGSPVPMGEFTEALYRPLAQPGSGYENSDFGSLYKWLEKSIG